VAEVEVEVQVQLKYPGHPVASVGLPDLLISQLLSALSHSHQIL
jgi:hypothetical protein